MRRGVLARQSRVPARTPYFRRGVEIPKAPVLGDDVSSCCRAESEVGTQAAEALVVRRRWPFRLWVVFSCRGFKISERRESLSGSSAYPLVSTWPQRRKRNQKSADAGCQLHEIPLSPSS